MIAERTLTLPCDSIQVAEPTAVDAYRYLILMQVSTLNTLLAIVCKCGKVLTLRCIDSSSLLMCCSSVLVGICSAEREKFHIDRKRVTLSEG